MHAYEARGEELDMGAGDFVFKYVVGGLLLTVFIYLCRYFHETRLLGNTICFFGMLTVLGLFVGEFFVSDYGLGNYHKLLLPNILNIEHFYPISYIFFTIGVFFYSIREQLISRRKMKNGD